MDINVIYWIGQNASEKDIPEDCFFHEIIDAYQLKKLYSVPVKSFDLNNLSLAEYYNYIKILDRSDNIGGFSFSLRDRIFKEQLNYWYSVLSYLRPDSIVFYNTPHLICDYPLYIVAKFMEIKTMIFNVTPFIGVHYATNRIGDFENKSNLVKLNDDILNNKKHMIEKAIKPYENYNYELPSYIKRQYIKDSQGVLIPFLKTKTKLSAKWVFSSIGLEDAMIHLGFYKKLYRLKEDLRFNYDFYSFTGEYGWVSRFNYQLIKKRFQKRLKSELDRNIVQHYEIERTKKYIYVPLHYQPEATTAPNGGLYSDQIYMVERLREQLPDDVTIIVKEHYSQFSNSLYGFRGRYLSYWEKLNSIQNLLIAPMDFDQKKLILNSLAVATVTGTAGWEAIQYGKFCINFGEPWYKRHPNSINFDELNPDELELILYKKPLSDSKLNSQFLNEFCESVIFSDILDYHSGAVLRSSKVVVNAILKFVKVKTIDNNE